MGGGCTGPHAGRQPHFQPIDSTLLVLGMNHQARQSRVMSYLDFVKFRAKANPCVAGLLEHLQRESRAASRIVYLDYPPNESPKLSEPVSAVEADVANIVERITPHTTRFLFVENVTSTIVSTLGEALDIDPLFFAEYINYRVPKFGKAGPAPSLACDFAIADHVEKSYSPSSLPVCGFEQQSRFHYSIHVDDRLQYSSEGPATNTDIRETTLPCSGIFLVDPLINAVDVPDMEPHKSYQARVFSDGFEDFASPPLFSSFAYEKASRSLNETSMLDRMIYYLQMRQPPGFHVNSPSILSVGYYPVRIVLSEWSFYAHLMNRCSKYDQYSFTNKPGQLRDEDLVHLQRWRRRIKRGKQRLDILAEVINFKMQYEDEKEPWHLVLKDINWLRKQLQEYCESLEQMVTVATSMVQLLDSRRSMLEAVNMRRLTYIAMVFIPLAWVASLFSMSDAYTPGNESFWVYVATALPLLGVVLILSILPYDRIYGTLRDAWEGKEKIRDMGKMSRLPLDVV
ncbi:hypothetical protein CEP52_008632 [Fusarium oligoseptatum]|uniref:Uncharacterized protein n=1 Tax=Fusarium oligoseptatum TaxID=2604345 RepID=A0A428TH46_9HYPO|nr:hypothetical protein CEP52_008632 [Fusarium oligoseptatum]